MAIVTLSEEVLLNSEMVEAFKYSLVSIECTTLADCVSVPLWGCHKVP